MDYSQFVGIVRERNRPSGGIKTVQEVAVNAFINSSKKILEIGSNTGFTSVNMSLLTGCKCIGIDINKNSVKEARRYAKINGVNKLVKFSVYNAEKLPYKKESFDCVWCSNVTSFIKNKEKAIKEYIRVLKKNGILIVVPIYYIKKPSNQIVKKISQALNSEIKIWSKSFWLKLFEEISLKQDTPLQLFYSKDFKYLNREKYIEEYASNIIEKEHIQKYDSKKIKEVKDKIIYFMELFNQNLKYAGYSILLYQKRVEKEEIELFLTKKNEYD
ncbi:MAG: class I SAM-dependent methyltransferase [Candidatus Nanoarchaeia archaeon]|nr:class I SAM-dependent methyltransferase [Candidatus Nanoarchaeia archaeon]